MNRYLDDDDFAEPNDICKCGHAEDEHDTDALGPSSCIVCTCLQYEAADLDEDDLDANTDDDGIGLDDFDEDYDDE